jgi:tripartite-type tricarboxylate transporter receptor subunit TctC
VSLLGTSPLYLLAHPSLAANDTKELIALVRSQPGKISYGSSGLGSIHHLAMSCWPHFFDSSSPGTRVKMSAPLPTA